MIELHSLEAEHGLLGAMMLQPHLIDVLADGLSADAFAWNENSELFRLILEMHDESKPIDVITACRRRPPPIDCESQPRQTNSSVTPCIT